eukprot:280023_1
MALSPSDIGFLIWSISCFSFFCLLVLYDGCHKKDLHLISGVYCVYLLSHTIAGIMQIMDSHLHSTFLSYIMIILLSLAACVYLIMAILFTFIPLNKHVEPVVKYGIPLLYSCFVVALIFVPQSQTNILLFALYLPCALFAGYTTSNKDTKHLNLHVVYISINFRNNWNG